MKLAALMPHSYTVNDTFWQQTKKKKIICNTPNCVSHTVQKVFGLMVQSNAIWFRFVFVKAAATRKIICIWFISGIQNS